MLLEQTIKQTIFEAVMDQEATRLSNMVMRDVINTFYPDALGDYPPVFKKAFAYKTSFGLPVNIFVSKKKIDKARVGNGLFTPNDPETGKGSKITIEIQLPLRPEKSGLSDLVKAFKTVLVHELEHARQEQRGGTILGPHGPRDYGYMKDEVMWGTAMGALDYFLRPSEVEAYVMQFYKNAKMKKKPFLEVLDKWIVDVLEKNFTFSEKSKAMVIRSIRKAFIEYAKKRLPALANNPLHALDSA